MIFSNLRIVSWDPEFMWIKDNLEKVADYINKPHEDYPTRINDTYICLKTVSQSYTNLIESKALLGIHNFLFRDKYYAGQLRKVNVTVAIHIPPHFSLVPELMKQLENSYNNEITTIEKLIEWYKDFETIHPFQDGNGRIGGIVVALVSNMLHSNEGYLTVLQ